MMRPLSACWRIRAAALPDRLKINQPRPFSLPGEEALSGFSSLFLDEEAPSVPAPDSPEEAPFPLPNSLPEDARGPVELVCTLDFDRLRAQNAEVLFELFTGSGQAYLDDTQIAAFSARRETLIVKLPPSRCQGRRTLRLAFDETRPAGLAGPVTLHTTSFAQLEDILLSPNEKQQLLTLTVCAQEAGTYVLHAQAACRGIHTPLREQILLLEAGERRCVHLLVDAPVPRFSPGTPYEAPAVAIQLFLRTRPKSRLPGFLCDSETLLCGRLGRTASYDLPLTPEECFLPPDTLLHRLGTIPAVCVPVLAPEAFYRAMTRAGVAVRQITLGQKALKDKLRRFPCVSFQKTPAPSERLAPDTAVSCWQLCGMTAFPSAPPAGLTAVELLREASGRTLVPDDAHTLAVLDWLRAFSVRLRAEAARQGRVTGPLCFPGEWNKPDIAAALDTAFAPTHLSALPLFGAWWVSTHFSAALRVFLAPGEETEGLTCEAVLEDEQGKTLARVFVPCPKGGGDIGVLQAFLSHKPGVLTLYTRLRREEAVIEESQMPVYVGVRGMLETAF